MFDVFAFLIENFQDLESCPQRDELSVYLEQEGFEGEDINDALNWIDSLLQVQESPNAALIQSQGFRVYSEAEKEYIPSNILGLIQFLETEHALNPSQRELVIDALLLLPRFEINTQHTKMLVLIVLWAQKSELPVLIGDDLLAAIHGEPTMQ